MVLNLDLLWSILLFPRLYRNVCSSWASKCLPVQNFMVLYMLYNVRSTDRIRTARSMVRVEYRIGAVRCTVRLGFPELQTDLGLFHWASSLAYCTALCDPRCCSSRKATRASPSELVKVEEGCGWRNRFDSIASSTYQINGNRFFDPAGQDFMGVDTVQV